MNQLISVIIPVYNVEKYLDRCIESVINQTYKNIEIILVNDGSVDKSPEICDSWSKKDCRIKVVHKENSGAGIARNTGIEHAAGDYVLFVDSDDYINKNTVEKCYYIAKKDKSEMVMYGRTDVDSEGNEKIKPVLTTDYVFKNKEVTDVILPGLFTNEKGFGVGVCGKLIDLNVIRNYGIKFRSEREILSEDALFLIELFSHISSVSILPENYYYYFQNDKSFSRTFKKDFQIMNDRFLDNAVEKCSEYNYSEKTFNHLKARYLIYCLSGMKQLTASDLPSAEKKKLFRGLFKNAHIRNALTDEVIALSSPSLQFFWKLYKSGFYSICLFMLWIKTRN